MDSGRMLQTQSSSKHSSPRINLDVSIKDRDPVQIVRYTPDVAEREMHLFKEDLQGYRFQSATAKRSEFFFSEQPV